MRTHLRSGILTVFSCEDSQIKRIVLGFTDMIGSIRHDLGSLFPHERLFGPDPLVEFLSNTTNASLSPFNVAQLFHKVFATRSTIPRFWRTVLELHLAKFQYFDEWGWVKTSLQPLLSMNL